MHDQRRPPPRPRHGEAHPGLAEFKVLRLLEGRPSPSIPKRRANEFAVSLADPISLSTGSILGSAKLLGQPLHHHVRHVEIVRLHEGSQPVGAEGLG